MEWYWWLGLIISVIYLLIGLILGLYFTAVAYEEDLIIGISPLKLTLIILFVLFIAIFWGITAIKEFCEEFYEWVILDKIIFKVSQKLQGVR